MHVCEICRKNYNVNGIGNSLQEWGKGHTQLYRSDTTELLKLLK
jgi:hypothetical protein